MNKQNCIIVHGCPSTPKDKSYNKHWIPWTKRQLEEEGITVQVPTMPEPWQPNYEKFKFNFPEKDVNENTILIGHSCGCAFLVRWLGESKKRASRLILVAPWKIPDKKDKFRKEFYIYPIDKTIKDRVSKITLFTSDNEEKDGKESLKIFHKAFGGNVIELKGKGHYTFGDMETEEFPELINAALE